MSAIANIVINDGQATPVAHTFYPTASDPDAQFAENLSGIALIGNGNIKVSVKRVAQDGGMNRVRIVMALPALETASAQNSAGYTAAPKVAYTHTVSADFILPNRGTAQQRKDLRVLLANLLANAQVVDAIENLARPY
jgi:hypothetical protein